MQSFNTLAEVTLSAQDAISAAIPVGVAAIIFVVKHFLTRGGDREKRTYGFEDGIVKALQETIADLRLQVASLRTENHELELENRQLLKQVYGPKSSGRE